jgi:hypothetical protein
MIFVLPKIPKKDVALEMTAGGILTKEGHPSRAIPMIALLPQTPQRQLSVRHLMKHL